MWYALIGDALVGPFGVCTVRCITPVVRVVVSASQYDEALDDVGGVDTVFAARAAVWEVMGALEASAARDRRHDREALNTLRCVSGELCSTRAECHCRNCKLYVSGGKVVPQ
jgi:hypothetical protein